MVGETATWRVSQAPSHRVTDGRGESATGFRGGLEWDNQWWDFWSILLVYQSINNLTIIHWEHGDCRKFAGFGGRAGTSCAIPSIFQVVSAARQVATFAGEESEYNVLTRCHNGSKVEHKTQIELRILRKAWRNRRIRRGHHLHRVPLSRVSLDFSLVTWVYTRGWEPTIAMDHEGSLDNTSIG